MLNLRKIKLNSRALFEKPFYQMEVKLTILDDNYVFVGSSKDEIVDFEKLEFKDSDSTAYKIEEISKRIEPMASTILIDGQPYIPGSTLKGMIRFNLEHSFKGDAKDYVYSCFIKQDRPEARDKIKNFLKKFNYWPNAPRAREDEKTRPDRGSRKEPDEFCRVCDLFGNTNFSSRVVFSDAFPMSKIDLESKDIVAGYTDRKRIIPPESQFSFKINVNNAKLEDLALLYIGTNLYKDGILLLGMHKFAPKNDALGELINFGKIRLEVMKITKFIYDNSGFTETSIDPNEFLTKIKEEINNNLKNILRNF